METFKRLLTYYKYKWPLYLTGVITLSLSTALSLYSPIINGEMIDYISSQLTQGAAIDFGYVFRLFGIFILLIILSASLQYISNYMLQRVANYQGKVIRDQVYTRLQKLPVSFFDNKPPGQIASRIINDTEVIRQNFFHSFGSQSVVNLMYLVGIYIAVILVMPEFTLPMTLLIIFIILWQVGYIRLTTPLNASWREMEGSINTQISDLIQGVSMVQLYHQEDKQYQDFEATKKEWIANRDKSVVYDTVLSWNLSNFLRLLVTLGLMIYLGTRFVDGVLGYTVGTLYIIMNYVERLFGPIGMLIQQIVQSQQALAGAKRVFEILDQVPEDDSEEMIEITQGNVVFNQVTFGYTEEQTVLKDINLKADKGETVALVGHTGSGKSSIINLLFRFYDPQEGDILIDNQRIVEFNRDSIRQEMGIVLQDPFLFSGTIATNVSMKNPAITDEQVMDALEKVGAKPLIDKLAKGIHEPVIEKGQTLSSGERQLISFDRALVTDPKILILDEATSHIDSQTEELIQQAINVVKEGRTTFIIAHRLSTIQNADQILVLESGVIRERGKHSQLMQANGIYAEMFRMQANGTPS
ncbi:ABC transporter ATP-binding protein [Fundicoccus culcitae]|uniref:ABC transporter ATP-binding protein/permease n=1 Tax=Fundicoccus culcitae TaxID=2969821 RepID=A0ABY5P368_9LACT|nr:ABC transporter ATP-binding protein [Fundicoccus culcitae]UUX33172.1 ABC transporter ATP-binding protein/permease [Fundicoccus culcitae]